MKKKIADRLHIHKNLEEFHKHVSIDLLPSDVGGKQLSRREIIGNFFETCFFIYLVLYYNYDLVRNK